MVELAPRKWLLATDPKKLDGFFSETDFVGTPQYHILELLM